MTKKDYFRQRFASLGLSLSDADLLDLNIPDLSNEATVDEQKKLYITFIKFIPQMLLHPSSVSEGGTSLSRASKDDIIAFYGSECKRLGLKDELTKKPRVIFI
ncbi:DUF6706 family protein [Capnocytophaga sp. oral taxon 338]|uniref:DUF6706 family protein n=1 Tax=Capnocytophaga sp. oral taxon 338 TaxID=710239 RepID=UPI000202D6D5|nr:DUF6706 family protein [Capnocytophaga sp. oral taxon 338]EGD33349.1 hypothetical protein HMPREF9071_2143 [Capnocytophaga sp. oral taxon 338 str. F0234]